MSHRVLRSINASIKCCSCTKHSINNRQNKYIPVLWSTQHRYYTSRPTPLLTLSRPTALTSPRRHYATPPGPGGGKKVYSRDRPHVNVGTIGHIDHGKTTLTAAITHVLSKKKQATKMKYSDIDNAPEEKKRGITIAVAHVEYMTDSRHYSHTDCPGHADFVKNMIVGASQMDGAIVVVAATDGAMPQTKEHLILAKQIGLKNVVVYINKVDVAEEEMVELVEMEMRELLTQFGFDGDNTPFIKGSALCALEGKNPEMGANSIKELLAAVDETIPVPERDVDKPFVMYIEKSHKIPGRGTVAVGRVDQGSIKKGQDIQIDGMGLPTIKTLVTGMETFHKQMDTADSGDQCGLLLRGLKRSDIKRGMVVARPGEVSLYNNIDTKLYLLSKDEGGRHVPVVNYQLAKMFSKTWDVTCQIEVVGKEMMMPGEDATVRFTMVRDTHFTLGQKFTIRMGEQTVGTGVVTKINPNLGSEAIDLAKGGLRLREKMAAKAAKKKEKEMATAAQSAQ